MTVDKLIERLQFFKDQIGGDCEVKVIDEDGECGFGFTRHPVRDEESETGWTTVLYLDLTAQPE